MIDLKELITNDLVMFSPNKREEAFLIDMDVDIVNKIVGDYAILHNKNITSVIDVMILINKKYIFKYPISYPEWGYKLACEHGAKRISNDIYDYKGRKISGFHKTWLMETQKSLAFGMN